MRILSITTAIFIVLASWIPSTLAPGPPQVGSAKWSNSSHKDSSSICEESTIVCPEPTIGEKPNPNT